MNRLQHVTKWDVAFKDIAKSPNARKSIMKLRNILNSGAAKVAALSITLVVAAASVNAQSAKGPADVNVVNTPNVNVVNTPGVNVNNTPNVNIANSPEVKVTNTPAVRDADNPARQPVEASTGCTVTDQSGGCLAPAYTVPSGKRLVIEFVTMNARVPSSIAVSQLTILAGGRTYFLPQTPPNVDYLGEQENSARLAQQVRIYVEPGMSVVMHGRHNQILPAQSAAFDFTLSGYLVDVQ
jgi:hypothetical protein